MYPFVVCLTHDIDRVVKTYQYISHALKALIQRKGRRVFYHLASLFGSNPYWNFKEIMRIEESFDVRSTLFFLNESFPFKLFSVSSWNRSLGYYKFLDPKIREIIKTFDRGGWEIGLHGSYNSYRNLALLKSEKHALEEIVGHEVIGIRQHYLNLVIPDTWRLQKEVALKYDASLGIKNNVGFPENHYHPFRDEASGMVVLPLAIMDKYLFELSIHLDDAWNRCLAVIDEAEKKGALLVVLWHQRVFNEKEFPGYKLIYTKIIEECKRRNALFKVGREVYEEFSDK